MHEQSPEDRCSAVIPSSVMLQQDDAKVLKMPADRLAALPYGPCPSIGDAHVLAISRDGNGKRWPQGHGKAKL